MARTRKRAYTGGKRYSVGCRNHGSCGYCAGNRQHADVKRAESADIEAQALLVGESDSYPLEHGQGYANPQDFE